MDLHEECRRIHRAGVEERSQMPYANSGIPFRILPYDETQGHRQILEMAEGVDDRARFLIRNLVVGLFRAERLYAAILQSDTRMADMHKFVEHFGLSYEMGAERIQEEYYRILTEQFGGWMENLPRHLWYDAIATTVKGPKVPALLVRSRYHGDEQDRVVWDESQEVTGVISEILPDWWESTVQ